MRDLALCQEHRCPKRLKCLRSVHTQAVDEHSVYFFGCPCDLWDFCEHYIPIDRVETERYEAKNTKRAAR